LNCDVMVVSPHPDDAEIGCGGVIKNLTDLGKSVVFVDCTRGELGTRGSAELRATEAESAGKILGVSNRVNLEMPDCAVEYNTATVHKLATAIRKFTPLLVLIPPPQERHPDHVAVHQICKAANFVSGVKNVLLSDNGNDLSTHRAKTLVCYQLQYDFPSLPDFYVDVTDTFKSKMDAILAYQSQFHVENSKHNTEPPTFISRPEYLLELEARARYYGSRIGTTYAEAFFCVEPLGLSSLSVLL